MEGIIEARKDLLDVMMGVVPFNLTGSSKRQRYMQQASKQAKRMLRMGSGGCVWRASDCCAERKQGKAKQGKVRQATNAMEAWSVLV
jgi:hypothetical protein